MIKVEQDITEIEQNAVQTSAQGALYGPEYYASHLGPLPYIRTNPQWLEFFGAIADELIRTFRPARVFDAGCAHGFLVESFWDRGVEAWGRDISEYAISQVRPDVRQFCSVGSLSEPITGPFDLVVCIEVLEHMPEEEAKLAISHMTAVANRIVFSSSPTDLTEPTHINVKPPIYWMRRFSDEGFAPVGGISLPYITPYALVFARSDVGRRDEDLLTCAELVRVRMQVSERDRTIIDLLAQLDTAKSSLKSACEELSRLRSEHQKLATSTLWRSTWPIRSLAQNLSPRARRWLRQALKFLWWCATLQIGARRRRRTLDFRDAL